MGKINDKIMIENKKIRENMEINAIFTQISI